MVDGGLHYLKRSNNKVPYEELSVYAHEPFEKVRQHVVWGSCGKKGDGPLKINILCNMSTPHIEAIINDGLGAEWIRDLMKKEIIYRLENDIYIPD